MEDLIDALVVADGSGRSLFIVTAQHEGETLEGVMEFAAAFNASDGRNVQLVRL